MLLLLLDQVIIKEMHIYCLCLLMELLTHYNHVIVHSHQHVSLPGAFFFFSFFLNVFKDTVLMLFCRSLNREYPVLFIFFTSFLPKREVACGHIE